MFFDEPLVTRKSARLHLPPAVPNTGWKPLQPHEWPNLSAASVISFDTETKDPHIDDYGPGWARGDGHIVGISMTAQARNGERCSFYLPMRHEFEPEMNLDPNQVLAFTRNALSTNIDKIGANLTYDYGWLKAEGVHVAGKLYDVQFAEALIDNEAMVALDTLGEKYLSAGKVTSVLYNWIDQAYPNTKPTKRRANIYRSPPRLVGPYAVADSDIPLDVYAQQERILYNEGLQDVFRLECDLIPLMVEMRMHGVRVDLDHAEKLYHELMTETPLLFQEIRDKFGYNLQSTASSDLGAFFAYVGIDVPRTEAGAYSVRKEWLAGLEHPAGDMVNNIREHEKICGTFINSYILKGNHYGRLHPQFHQLHSEDGGTKVGRFSSSIPNLQNIPSRTKLGKRVREAFTHNHNHFGWRKFDFSQVHYRLLAHFAVGPGSDALRQRYIDDPETDYHMDVYRNVAPLLRWNTDYVKVADKYGKLDWNDDIKFRRRPIKNVNFGLLYGQSSKSLAYKAGFTQNEADEFFTFYHQGAPYVKPTMEAIGAEVQEFGYVKTLLGRRIRFHEWEPIKKNWDNPDKPLLYHDAIAKWGGGIKRAYEYRGVNYKFQGSEPDIMKTAMRNLYYSGVFNVTGVPLVTVHDELDFSVIDDSPQQREAYDFIQNQMQNAIKLRIPVYVDESNGPSWGKAD